MNMVCCICRVCKEISHHSCVKDADSYYNRMNQYYENRINGFEDKEYREWWDIQKEYARNECRPISYTCGKCRSKIEESKRKNAYSEYNKAIRKGLLRRPVICDECKRFGQIEGHHSDYSKPTQIKWLCKRCHGKTRRIHSKAN